VLPSEPEFRWVGMIVLAGATAALGLISLAAGDFAYTWQPVPETLPARAIAARVTGALLVVVSAFFVIHRADRRAVVVFASVFLVWLLLLHLPAMIRGEGWLGFFEFLLPLGACMALASAAALSGASSRAVAEGELLRAGRVCFGIGLIGCGASHFVYADFAAQMIPEWMPARLFWTYLTGAGHVAAGLSLISGWQTRTATALLCFMLACFVFLLHVPRVLAQPNRFEWTMLIVAVLFNGAAWIMAGVVRSGATPQRA
jgi:uncharacterized membrane protein YphA (DoxX/SURF4 family)